MILLFSLLVNFCIYGACLMAAHNLVFREQHHKLSFPDAFKYSAIVVVVGFAVVFALALCGLPLWALWIAYVVTCAVTLKKAMDLFWTHAAIIAVLFLVIRIAVDFLWGLVFGAAT
jgi:hypothetical protein